MTSPVDGLGQLIIPPQQNIMFESDSKESQEALPSRIASVFYIHIYILLHPTQLRTLIYQRIRHGDTPFPKPRVSFESGLQKFLGVFLWLVVDKVGRRPHMLVRFDSKFVVLCHALL